MGDKEDKIQSESVLTTDLLLEKLATITAITAKKMFGGYGIFHEGKMFGLVDSKGTCFLKADDSNIEELKALGAHQHSRMPYYSISRALMRSDFNKLLEITHHAIEISK